MSHILLLPVGSAGDVLPFIWLGRQLRARGHEVTMITAAMFEDAARGAGLDFTGVGTKEEFEAVMRDARIWKPYHSTKFIFEYAAKNLGRARDEIRSLCAKEKPALMIGSLLALGARLAREELGIPLVTVHLQPSVILSVHDTPVFLSEAPWLARLPRWLKQLAFAMPNPIERGAMPWVRKACAEAGVKPPRSLMKEWWHSPDGVLLLFPEWFAAPQPDWPQPRYQHTFPLEDLAAEQPLSAELRAFLAAGEKPVVFTPGSANVQAHQFFEAALGAMTALGKRAVFVTRDVTQLPANLPPSIFVAEYAPFGPLVREAAVFVHHGGIGTLSQGFAAGVPQLLMPMAHDQPDNENRLRRLGAGFGIVPKRFTASNVVTALEKLTTDAAFASSAQRCAALIKSGPHTEAMMNWVSALMIGA